MSKKEYAALEAKQKETQDLLNTATVKLNAVYQTKQLQLLEHKLWKNKLQIYVKTMIILQVLSAKGASNVEKTLESIKEKDLKLTVYKML